MRKNSSVRPAREGFGEDHESLADGVNKIIQSLESGMIGAAMETRRDLMERFSPDDFRTVDGFEEAVIHAHRKANIEGSTAEAARIRRNFGKGIDFPRISRQAETDDDEADLDYKIARELLRDRANSDEDLF